MKSNFHKLSKRKLAKIRSVVEMHVAWREDYLRGETKMPPVLGFTIGVGTDNFVNMIAWEMLERTNQWRESTKASQMKETNRTSQLRYSDPSAYERNTLKERLDQMSERLGKVEKKVLS